MTDKLLSVIERAQVAGLEMLGMTESSYLESQQTMLERIRSKLTSHELRNFDASISKTEPPTKLQSLPLLVNLKKTYAQAIWSLEHSGHKGRHVPDHPILATAFSGNVNGEVLFDSPNNYAFLIDESLFHLSTILPKALIAALIPLPGDDTMFSENPVDIRERISSRTVRQSIFDDCMLSTISLGSVSFSDHFSLDRDKSDQLMIGGINEGIMLFVLGHEIGHINEGHFSNQRFIDIISSNRLVSRISNEGFPVYRARQLMEHCADISGFNACFFQDAHPVIKSFQLFGLFSLLYFQEVTSHLIILWSMGKERYKELFDDKVFDLSLTSVTTHPSGGIRAMLLLDLFASNHPDREIVSHVQLIHSCARETIKAFWLNFIDSISQDDIEEIPANLKWHESISQMMSTLVIKYDDGLEDEVYSLLGVDEIFTSKGLKN